MQRTKKPEENKIKTRELNKGRKIKTLLSSPIHLAHHRSTVKPLSDIAMMLLCCRSTVAPLLSLLMLLCSCTAIAPLLLRCCRSCCCYAVAPLSHRCRAVVEPQPLRPREGINNTILNCCCSTVTPLSLLLSIGRFTRLSPQEA